MTLEEIDNMMSIADEGGDPFEGGEIDVCEILRLARRGLSALPRPISEAPKDGSNILVVTDHGLSEIVFYDADYKKWFGRGFSRDISDVTYLIPLSELDENL